MNHVMSELCFNKGTILQRNDRKMTIIWSFFYNFFVKFHDKQRGMCIKGIIWPPVEPKSKSCFSPISSDWFIRRIAQV